MPKLVYLMPTPNAQTGGNKSTCRHVEALVRMGYDAVVRVPPRGVPPAWFRHAAPFERAPQPPAPDDILVVPEDNIAVLSKIARLPNRKVVHCKNPYNAMALGVGRLPAEERAAYRTFMTCADGVTAWIARYFDPDIAMTVPSYVDATQFHPRAKARIIACMPRKRRFEAAAIRSLFERLREGREPWRWDLIHGRPEAQAATAVGEASVFLSLARFEGLSMSILEALASGCLVAGFTGIGAREYTTPSNGLWVEEDDCEAAARALVQAVGLIEADGAEAAAFRAQAIETARHWSEAAAIEALESFWRDRMGVAPARALSRERP